MYTEEEAKQKWCPFVRISEATETDSDSPRDCGVANRDRHDGNAIVGSNCLASGCMAWRWLGPSKGFCGLAGMGSPVPEPNKPDETPYHEIERNRE